MVPVLMNTVDTVDRTFLIVIGISLAMLLLITVLMVYFSIRYNRKRSPEPTEIHGNLLLEIIWTVIPTIIVLIIFMYGWGSYTSLRTVPENAVEIKVIGRMYSWSFVYPDGRETRTLIVEQGIPVKLNVTSEDVLHSFFLPAFRTKIDAVPGMETYTWFLPQKPDVHDIFCAEYCGLKHHAMTADLVVVTTDQYRDWMDGIISAEALLAEAKNLEFAEAGPGLRVLMKYDCLKCHTIDGRRDAAPTFKGILGREVRVITNGSKRSLTTDREYIIRSVREPSADIVAGFDALMSPYTLSDDEMTELLDYLETLND